MTNTTKNARTNGNGSNTNQTKKGEIEMKQTTTDKNMATIVEMMHAQTQAIAALLTRIEKLEKSSATLDKPALETKVQPQKQPTRKQASAPAREEKPAKQPKKQSTPEKKSTLKTVRKFGTQVYLRAPRDKGNVEVAHVNEKTKRGRCVATIHAKAQAGDMGLIREFILSYEKQLSYTAKLAKAGIKSAADLRKATDAQLMAAFGC